MAQLSFHSPIGDLTISEENNKIISLDWGWSPLSRETAFLKEIKQQLDDYFDGLNPEFTQNLNPYGTDFQKYVWRSISKIYYGKTMTYEKISKIVGSHPRAIGTACGLNPIPILIPCHRVIGKTGKLTGYSGGDGLETKKFLLELEKQTS